MSSSIPRGGDPPGIADTSSTGRHSPATGAPPRRRAAAMDPLLSRRLPVGVEGERAPYLHRSLAALPLVGKFTKAEWEMASPRASRDPGVCPAWAAASIKHN